MGEKLVVGPINKGLRTDREPFVIDNDSFPVMINAYQWRGRVKRKRGTQFLGRLTRFFNSLSTVYNPGSTTITLDASGNGNILTGFTTLTGNPILVLGQVTINDTTSGNTYVDNSLGGLNAIANITGATQSNPCVLTANNGFTAGQQVLISGVGGMTQLNGNTYTITVSTSTHITINVDSTGFTAYTSGGVATNLTLIGTINYNTGSISIPLAAGHTINASFNYYPDLPAMGLEDFITTSNAFPFTLGFDTIYSYNILTVEPYSIYDVSFYNNLSNGTYPGYIAKTLWTPTTWNGEDYQQFYTVNYQGALWATNGIDVPFTGSDIGMQFNLISGITISAGGPPAIVVITLPVGHNLVVGDFVFINEVIGMTGINLQTGYVTISTPTTITVEFPNATIAGSYSSAGIVQYLTNRSNKSKDCLRWYNGDPTNGNITSPGFVNGRGWVNFAPPLNNFIAYPNFSVGGLNPAQYYLVGARMIVPFKDRLMFLGPVVQTSSGSPIYLQDTVIFSQNGTPYYTCSYTNTPSAAVDTPISATNVFHPILVPLNQVATPFSFFEDATGFGGFITAGVDQPMKTVSSNEDALIIGFDTLQTRLIYSGNDIVPFNFFIINAELGSSSTFSTINMDQGVITRGSRGYVITGQTSAQRIDVEIPDQVFEIDLLNNGEERFCAQRDFINEWVYFTYPSNNTTNLFPDTTLQYNYRDNSWAIFHESYTTYGSFRRQTGFTWATVGQTYPTWSQWNDPWDSGESTLLQPQVIAGNQQGFVIIKGVGTSEQPSLYVDSFASSVVTSPNHNLNLGDYIQITGCLGGISSQVNGKIFSVSNPTTNTFTLNPAITNDTYLGGGLITKFSVPFIQTKQFPVSWGLARKTRIGNQQYLLSKTSNSQMTLLIYLSQDNSDPYNDGPIIPDILSVNDSLIYSTILFTCPESTNLGLTPANINLQMVTANNQQQIWHRINTSLIGDTIQLGFTLSDSQMRSIDPDIGELPSFTITNATQSNPCVLTCRNSLTAGDYVQINGIVGMTQLNFSQSSQNFYKVLSSTGSTLTINVDSTSFSPYRYGGTATFSVAITGATQANPCVLTVSPNNVSVGQLIQINGVSGMVQLNFNPSLNNNYYVVSTTSTTITIQVDSTMFTAYTSGGSITPMEAVNQTAEIELHGFILDVSPSQLLA
jgi:Ubiquitin-activating enzyme E1 FCCH domain